MFRLRKLASSHSPPDQSHLPSAARNVLTVSTARKAAKVLMEAKVHVVYRLKPRVRHIEETHWTARVLAKRNRMHVNTESVQVAGSPKCGCSQCAALYIYFNSQHLICSDLKHHSLASPNAVLLAYNFQPQANASFKRKHSSRSFFLPFFRATVEVWKFP